MNSVAKRTDDGGEALVLAVRRGHDADADVAGGRRDGDPLLADVWDLDVALIRLDLVNGLAAKVEEVGRVGASIGELPGRGLEDGCRRPRDER